MIKDFTDEHLAGVETEQLEESIQVLTKHSLELKEDRMRIQKELDRRSTLKSAHEKLSKLNKDEIEIIKKELSKSQSESQ